MQAKASLSQKLIRTGASLLVVALMSIWLTLWVTWQLEGGAAAVNEAGRMRMQTWRLTSAIQADMPSAEVKVLVHQFDESLQLLQTGDPTRPLFVSWDEASRAGFAKVQTLWVAQREAWLATPHAPSKDLVQSADLFVETIDAFVLTIEQQLSRLTALLNLFQFVMMALAVGGAVVMLYTGYLYVINPLVHLRQGLGQVEAGDFSTRIEVDTQDEFGQVAAGFNHMASTLQSLYEGLEAQVAIKTNHIEAQRSRLEALYSISNFLAKAPSIENLSRGFAQRIRELMQAEAVAVRWSDEASQRYLMLASDCLPVEIATHERSLLAGACACGNLKPDARTRVIPIQSHHEAPIQNCARAGYTSMLSVPVRHQQRLIGEINLFFRTAISLPREEVELLDALANHLASALESLRAAALEREAAVGEERALLARELHDSIAQSLAFLKIQLQLLRSASHKGQAVQVQTALDELDTGLRESISDVRELLVHFRTRTNTDDVVVALQETLQKFEHQTGLPAHLQVQGDGLPLPPDVQVQVLHVIQESLSNIRKHAQATQVHLDVLKGVRWQFKIRDNGMGFDDLATPTDTHVGLKIMRERAQRIGAEVAIASQHMRGTTITLTLPPYPVTETEPK